MAPPWGCSVVVEAEVGALAAAGVADAVGVGVALTEPVEVVGVAATAAASFSKKTTTSNDGGLPTPHGCDLRSSQLGRSTSWPAEVDLRGARTGSARRA